MLRCIRAPITGQLTLRRSRQRWRSVRVREQRQRKSVVADPMGWLRERGRKLLLSMPAWRGMVTFKRSSESSAAKEGIMLGTIMLWVLALAGGISLAYLLSFAFRR